MTTENKDNEHKEHPHKTHHIIVNGEEKNVSQESLTFHEICLLAFPDGPFAENIRYTVTYTPVHGADVSMVNEESVEIKNGMIFNVGNTDRS